MNNHGATVVGGDLRQLVSRAIFMCQNADYQLKARLLGDVATLTPGETRLAGVINALPNVTNRTWEYWTQRLERAGAVPPRAVAKPRPRPRAAAAGEHGRTLLDECAHALAIVGGEARLALGLALEVELAVEIVAPGFFQHTFGEREPDRRCRGEVQAEPVRFAHQFAVGD